MRVLSFRSKLARAKICLQLLHNLQLQMNDFLHGSWEHEKITSVEVYYFWYREESLHEKSEYVFTLFGSSGTLRTPH